VLDLVQALTNGAFIGAVFALAAVGLTLIFGVTNMINFAHGDFIMLAMYVGFVSWSLAGLDPLVAIPIAAITLTIVAVLVYVGVIRPVLGSTQLAQMVVTFGLLTFLRGVVQFAFTATPRRVEDPWVGGIRVVIGGVAFTGAQLVSAAGALVCTAALAWFVHRTETGRALQAVGEDPAGASLMGINANRMYGLAWALAGVSTGVAGALLINNFGIDPLAGAAFGIMSFIAVALGGFGSVLGAALAGLLLGVVQGVVGLYLSGYTLTAALGIYLLVLVVRPQGLRGTR
jgi:branched-chain amino acid transport system permease protein